MKEWQVGDIRTITCNDECGGRFSPHIVTARDCVVCIACGDQSEIAAAQTAREYLDQKAKKVVVAQARAYFSTPCLSTIPEGV